MDKTLKVLAMLMISGLLHAEQPFNKYHAGMPDERLPRFSLPLKHDEIQPAPLSFDEVIPLSEPPKFISQVMQQAIVNARPPVASGPNCSLCTLRGTQATNSGNSSAHSDGTTLNSVTAGDALVVFFTHDHWSAGGTTSISDNNGNTWHPCTGTGTGAFTDLEVNTTTGLSCFYALNVASGNTTMVAIAAQCVSVLCSLGGTYLEYSGVASTTALAYDGFGTTVLGTAGAGSNNTACGNTAAATATQTNDLVLCGVDMATGASTAGTSPVTFTEDQTGTWVAAERVVWTGSGSMNAKYTDSVTSDQYGAIELLLK